jgi:hypothetical protein
MELEYWANDELSYLEKTLQKPFDCHKTVIIKVVRGKRRKKKGENIVEGQKAQVNTS